MKSAKSVFYQSSSVEGEFRTRDLEIIAGDDKTETEYKESGCRFIVDVRKAAINKLAGNVISIHGDVSDVIRNELENKSDRTLMLLPEKSDEFLNLAILTAKNNGTIHYYSHIHADKKSDAAKLSEQHYLEIAPVKSIILGSKIVRPVGPRFYQTVVDIKIEQ